MHIALVTHKVVRGDGQGRINLEVAAAALRRGWRITLVASEADPQLLEHGNVRWQRIDVARWPTALVRNQVFALRSALWLQRNRTSIDLVHANGFITWARADLNSAHFVHTGWLRSAHRPRVLSARGLYHDLYAALNARLERIAYRGCDYVVAVSDQIRQQLLDIGVADEHVHVIPNGVDTAEFRPPTADERALEAARGAAVVGLFVGDLQTPRKNLHTVLRALRQCPDVHLDVAGTLRDSPYPAMAESLAISGRVRFLGYRNDVARLMRAADFVVFPSLYEPSGLVLFEAIASGVPVITARSVGGVEILDESCAIVIDDPADENALAVAINRLGESPALRTSMGAAGRRHALTLDFSLMGERYCNLYRNASLRRTGALAPAEATHD